MEGREDEMTCKRSLHRDLRRLLVARLTDENDVRVLPKKGAKDAGKIESDIFVRLDLTQTRRDHIRWGLRPSKC